MPFTPRYPEECLSFNWLKVWSGFNLFSFLLFTWVLNPKELVKLYVLIFLVNQFTVFWMNLLCLVSYKRTGRWIQTQLAEPPKCFSCLMYLLHDTHNHPQCTSFILWLEFGRKYLDHTLYFIFPIKNVLTPLINQWDAFFNWIPLSCGLDSPLNTIPSYLSS